MVNFFENKGSLSFGIRIRDTRTDDDEIYKNNFYNLDYANLANGRNAHPEGSEFGGLRYVCNSNSNNRFDFTVSDFNLLQDSDDLAIGRHQNGTGEAVGGGNPNIPSAANSFTSNPQELYGHFNNEGEFISYLPSTGAIYVPTSINNTIQILQDGLTNECSSYAPIVMPNLIKDQLEYVKQFERSVGGFVEWQNTNFLWLSIIDEGDTPSLKQEVELAWPEDTWLMRDKLLNISPNVSKQVLYEVADNTVVYPHPVAFDIFLANPDILKDSKFLKYLETKADPMPEYMVDLLYSARSQVTFRSDLAREMNHFRSQWLQGSYALIRANLQDEDSLTLALNDLNNLASLSPGLNTVFSQLSNGATSTDVLEALEDEHPLLINSEEFLQLTALLGWHDNLQNTSREWDEADSLEVQTLENIADHFNTYSGRTAQEILNTYYDQDWFIPPAIGGDWSPRAIGINLTSSEKDATISIYPNPANVALTIEIKLPLGVDQGVFRIFDSGGKEVLNHPVDRTALIFTLNTSNWSAGNYNWGIQAGNLYKSGKLVVQH